VGTPKCKLFAWLIFQNRVWTSDRLARRDWDHCPSCPPCRQTMETAHHLLASCRYTHRTWVLVAEWAGLTELRPAVWPASRSPRRWWKNLSHLPDVPRKGVRSLILLVIWEVWKERNDRVFNRRERSLFVWLISHQPAVFSSQNKPATSNQPAVLFSQNKSAPATSHQPNEQAFTCED
jgi:hypothetical protein